MHGAQNTFLNACILSAKNTHAPVHARLCNGAETSLPWKLLRTYRESCASIVQVVTVTRRKEGDHGRLTPALLLSRRNQSPDAVRSRNSSKSTLAHDTVAAVVSHTHHSIIHVGAGLIQFVCGTHSKRGHGAYPIKNAIFAIFRASFLNMYVLSSVVVICLY